MSDYKLRIVLELEGREVLVEEATLTDLWSLPAELGNPGALGYTGKRFMDRAIAVSALALDRTFDA